MTNRDALNELRGVAVTLQVLQEQNDTASPALLRTLKRISVMIDHAITHLEANEHINANKRAARSR